MIVLLMMTCINVNNMEFCSFKQQNEVSFYKRDVEILESLDYYPLPKADRWSAAEAIYGLRDRAAHMPDLAEGCKAIIKGKPYYYQYECKKLRGKLK